MATAVSNCVCSLQSLGIPISVAENSVFCSPSGRTATCSDASPFRSSLFRVCAAWRFKQEQLQIHVKLVKGAKSSKNPWKDYRKGAVRDRLSREELRFTLYSSGGLQKKPVVSTVEQGTPAARTANGGCGFCWTKVGRRRRRQRLVKIFCMVPHKGTTGRVGTHKREGNVSLASFGIRPKKGSQGEDMDLAKSLSGMLPYVVVATAIAALLQPATFAWVTKEYYAPALGGIMLSIGVQLSVKDFSVVLQKPLSVLVGYTLQYVVKPLLGMIVARAFHVPPAFAAGFILMASVAGAQLSSYASYLSEGDIALSVVLTSLTTITSVIMTPLLTGMLIGSIVPVDGFAMAKSIMQVVLGPVMIGLALNTYAKPTVDAVRPFLPLMAMVCTSMCIGSPLALNRAEIASIQGVRLLFPVIVFHSLAFAIGFWVSKLPLLRQDEKVARTLSLSTGMQSSTLAGLLATQFLGGSHAVPSACSVVVMAVMGLSLASFWGKGQRIVDVVNASSRNIWKGVSETDTFCLPQELRKKMI